MKHLPAIFLCLILGNCRQAPVVTYEAGLEKCKAMLAEKQRAKPNEYSVDPPECIIGAQIPAFEATTLEGVKINRESLKGKPSIINFWFTTCAPCVAEIPGFNALVEKFGTDKINCIAIGRDRREDIEEFLVTRPWSFAQIADGNTLIRETFKLRWGFPTTFILNKNAEIVLAFGGGFGDSTAVQAMQNKLGPILERELQQ